LRLAEFSLQQHLPHLMRRAHFEADAVFLALFGDEVTSRQLALLVAIAQTPGASQSQVAQDIGLDLNTCSDLVARSMSKGLVRRKRSTKDGRMFCLHVTAAGMRALDAGVARAAEYQSAVTYRLSKQEREVLAGLLRKMLAFD
jgi:MarR family transcriptional regulator, temperature-dependent positive regulator of motility